MAGKFFCTFHISSDDPTITYSLRRLKELLHTYIEVVNGEVHDMNPEDVQDMEECLRNLSRGESAAPLISFNRKYINGIDGKPKEILEILLIGHDMPFAMIDYQD